MNDSSNIIRFPQKEKIRKVAAYWIVQLDCGPLSDKKERKFIKWLNANRLHKKEFFDLCFLWGKYDFFSDLANIIPLGDPIKVNRNKKFNNDLNVSFVVVIVLAISILFVVSNKIRPENELDLIVKEETDPDQKTSVHTLENVITRLNTELKNKIVISDDGIKYLRMDDEFTSENLENFFRILQNQYLISVFLAKDNKIYLSKEEFRQL